MPKTTYLIEGRKVLVSGLLADDFGHATEVRNVELPEGFTTEELCANDWECEPKTATVSAADIREACLRIDSISPKGVEALIDELGLKHED